MFKRYLLAALAAALLIVTAGCGTDSVKENEAEAATKPEATATPTATPNADTDGDGLTDDIDDDPYAAEDTDGDGTADYEDWDENDPEVSSEEDDYPTDDEDYEENGQQTVRNVGQWGKDDGVKFKVVSMEAGRFDCGRAPGVAARWRERQAREQAGRGPRRSQERRAQGDRPALRPGGELRPARSGRAQLPAAR